jgi:hypothetical protein
LDWFFSIISSTKNRHEGNVSGLNQSKVPGTVFYQYDDSSLILWNGGLKEKEGIIGFQVV